MRFNLYTASCALAAYGVAANKLESMADDDNAAAANDLAQSY